jgi:hypothetical protein
MVTNKRTVKCADENEKQQDSCTIRIDALVAVNALPIIIIIFLWHICSKQELWSQRNSRC